MLACDQMEYTKMDEKCRVMVTQLQFRARLIEEVEGMELGSALPLLVSCVMSDHDAMEM